MKTQAITRWMIIRKGDEKTPFGVASNKVGKCYTSAVGAYRVLYKSSEWVIPRGILTREEYLKFLVHNFSIIELKPSGCEANLNTI